VCNDRKNLGAVHQKLGEIVGGFQNFFVPLILKTGSQIRNFTSKLEITQNDDFPKFFGKSRHYPKNFENLTGSLGAPSKDRTKTFYIDRALCGI